MEGEAMSMTAFLRSWFTPTVLFVLLNLVIGTIALTSKLAHSRHRKDNEAEDHRSISRSPSTVLDRVRSIGSLYRYRSGEVPLEAAPLTAQSETAEAVLVPPDPDAVQPEDHHLGRSQSEAHPRAGESMEGRMNRSASARSSSTRSEESVIVRRPMSVRDSGRAVEVEEEVDARADDFINRFRQQLKLQRLDSILRYKEMLNRGK